MNSIKKYLSHDQKKTIDDYLKSLIMIDLFRHKDIRIRLYIKKYTDEWYTARIEKVTRSPSRIDETYLCDQFDGLLECLGDVKTRIYKDYE